MFESKQTHCGQYKRYGDFFRVWEIKTDLPRHEAIQRCFNDLNCGKVLPSAVDFLNNTRYGGAKWNDPDYYFTGYYTTKEMDGGFEFAICEPFAD